MGLDEGDRHWLSSVEATIATGEKPVGVNGRLRALLRNADSGSDRFRIEALVERTNPEPKQVELKFDPARVSLGAQRAKERNEARAAEQAKLDRDRQFQIQQGNRW